MPMDVDENDPEWEVPQVQSVDDFELAKAVKEKGRPAGKYETLDRNTSLKSSLLNWDNVFIQFKDQEGKSSLHSRIWTCLPNTTSVILYPLIDI